MNVAEEKYSEEELEASSILEPLYKKFEYRGLIAYEEIFKELSESNHGIGLSYHLRNLLIGRYSWAIPNQKALETITKWSPHGIVEIGAGGGYWGYLLRQMMHLKCHLYDLNPKEPYGQGKDITMWTQVEKGSVEKLDKWGYGKTLFLCWPCYDESWAYEALLKWQLATSPAVIYIGEGEMGCTADQQFHNLLNGIEDCEHGKNKYHYVESVEIPNWDGIHDSLYVYENCSYGDDIDVYEDLWWGYEKIHGELPGYINPKDVPSKLRYFKAGG